MDNDNQWAVFIQWATILSPIFVAFISAWAVKSVKNLRNAQSEEARTAAAEKIKTSSLDLVERYEQESKELRDRVDALETTVIKLRAEIDGYRRDEEAYVRAMDAKDDHIRELSERLETARAERDSLRDRVRHLEDVCRRAGINGESNSHEVM